MPLQFDVRQYTDSQRAELARRIKARDDFPLPRLGVWNYDPCRVHSRGWTDYHIADDGTETPFTSFKPKVDCRKCGILFHKHQRISVPWLYVKKRALLADEPGLGKTISAGGLVALLIESGELGDGREQKGRVIISPRAPALEQWADQLRRMMPTLNIQVAGGASPKRRRAYLEQWQVLLISPQTLQRDYESLMNYRLSALITDDVDAIRNPGTETSYVMKRVGRHADRMVIMTGTPVQKKLHELWSTLEPIGGSEAFGSLDTFTRRHVRLETLREYNDRGQVTSSRQVTAYQGLDVVKAKMEPMVLRRRASDLTDITLPSVIPSDVYLTLYPAQAAKYAELKAGVLKIIKDQGTETKYTTAMSALIYGAQICTGLAALGEEDRPNTAVKLDWVQQKVTQDLSDEKVVVFAKYKNTVRALHQRFEAEGVKFVTVWGEDRDRKSRMESQNQFWDDPDTKVLIGTEAIEQSLNLQISRHLINMDMILNPARMRQLAGRIKRDGSAFKHVFVHNLLTVGTQEEKYLPLLEREAALSNYVWDESSELFAALSPLMMLQLITG